MNVRAALYILTSRLSSCCYYFKRSDFPFISVFTGSFFGNVGDGKNNPEALAMEMGRVTGIDAAPMAHWINSGAIYHVINNVANCGPFFGLDYLIGKLKSGMKPGFSLYGIKR